MSNFCTVESLTGWWTVVNLPSHRKKNRLCYRGGKIKICLHIQSLSVDLIWVTCCRKCATGRNHFYAEDPNVIEKLNGFYQLKLPALASTWSNSVEGVKFQCLCNFLLATKSCLHATCESFILLFLFSSAHLWTSMCAYQRGVVLIEKKKTFPTQSSCAKSQWSAWC